MTASRLIQKITGKNVVFITVKNKKYIRVSQITRLLHSHAKSYEVYASEKGNPLTRALDLKKQIKSMDLGTAEVVIVGFLPQLVWKDVLKQLRICKAHQRPILIAEFFLSLYDTVVLDRQLVSSKSYIARKLRGLDRRVLSDADLVITDTKANSEFFSREYKIDTGKFETLYLEADKSIYSPVDPLDSHRKDPQKNRKDSGNNEPLNVLYFGTGLPLQGIDTVLKAFALVAAKGKNITCTYIGSVKRVPKPVLDVARLYSDIEIFSWLSQEVLAERIRKADICLAGHFNPDIDKADRTIPGKAFIYEAMNKPMILADTKANHELFSQDEYHYFVPRGNAIALAECIASKIKEL